MPHNGQYQGHHPGTHSFPPSHPAPPEDQEPIDKIPKRAVVAQSKERAPGQLSPEHGGMWHWYSFNSLGSGQYIIHLRI